MKLHALALGVFGLFSMASLGACRDNTTCTIGDQICTDSAGKSAFPTGTQVRECSGADSGGDADGEFVLVDDCGAKGLICAMDTESTKTVCVTAECDKMTGFTCSKEGELVCILQALEMCTKVADNCFKYMIVEDCAMSGKQCVVSDSGPPTGCQ